MKSIKSLFALFTLLAVSFACAPLQEGSITEVPTPTPEVTIEDVAFPWIDDAANCCGQKPVDTPKPRIYIELILIMFLLCCNSKGCNMFLYIF